MRQAVAPQRFIVPPDAELMRCVVELRRMTKHTRGQCRGELFDAARRIEDVAQAHAELAAALAAKVAECAHLRAQLEA